MALKDQIVRPTRACVMARLVAVMSKEDAATLEEWIENDVPASRMASALRDEYPNNGVADKSFLVHLRGKCMCTQSDQFYGVWS